MKSSTIFQAKGNLHIVMGTIKTLAGKISSNTTLGVKGRFERIAGKVQRRVGKAQGILGF